MKLLLEFLNRHKGKVIIAILLLIGQSLGTLLIPALIAKVVDEGILPGNMEVIQQVGIQMLVVALLGTVIAVWGSFVTSDLGSRFGLEMRTKLFKKTQELSLSQFNDIGISSLITRSTSDITNLQQTLGMMFQMVVPSIILIVIAMVLTLQVSGPLAFIQFIFIILLIIFSIVILRKSNILSSSIQTRLDRINRIVRESITGVRVIRAFGNESYEEQRSQESYRDYADTMIKLNRLFAVFTPAVWTIMGILMVTILGLGGIFTLEGTMAVGEITAVSEYAILTIGYLMMAVSTLTTLPKAQACLKRLDEVLDTNPAITDRKKKTVNMEVKAKAIVEVQNVNFVYSGAEEAVIHDMSFNLNAGQTTAIIGSTGSGKSTLGDLLLRLHDITSGMIRLNGIDIRDLPQQELRERIASVPQKAFLFSGTIEDNLRMGNATASVEELWYALRIAQAEDFVKKLPLGLSAPVAQGGTNFSGGQRQRLSIARALVKQADVFLFDDSFSALDVKTDALLRKALKEHIATPVKLIIAQRISSIIDADQILVLEKGNLVGIGTHTQLLETCDTYRAIAESQMQKEEV